MAKKTKAAPPPDDMIIGPPKPAGDPDLQIPEFLKRERTPIPLTEDIDLSPKLDGGLRKDAIPHTEPPNGRDGLNVIEFYSNEGGQRRHLVVSIGHSKLQLLHLPDLEHTEAEVRDIEAQVKEGTAHWFDIPPNLADRLVNKSVQWEMYKFRYSRSLVNEALIKLGVKPLPEPQAVTDALGVQGEARREKQAASRAQRGPGVIDTIITILQEGGGTVDEMAAKLAAAFPDRAADGMKATIRTQLNRLPKSKGLAILKEGDRYRAEGSVPAKPAMPLAQKIAGTFDPPGERPGNDFIEQLHKQKSREKEYTEQPVVGKIDRKAKAKAKPKSKKRR